MSKQRQRGWWAVALVPVTLMLALSLSPVVVSPVSAAPLNSCTGPVAGQHVYDCANLLTQAEITTLEADAVAVERAGAPTVVYLQIRDATAQQTLNDARDLLNRWNIESRHGAGDGVVMFFNLQPGNPTGRRLNRRRAPLSAWQSAAGRVGPDSHRRDDAAATKRADRRRDCQACSRWRTIWSMGRRRRHAHRSWPRSLGGCHSTFWR